MELLGTILVIGILLAVLIPATVKVFAVAARAECASNLRQIGVGLSSYALDNNGRLPSGGTWDRDTAPYLGIVNLEVTSPILVCPSDDRDSSIRPRSYAVSAVSSPASPTRKGVFGRGNASSKRLSEIPYPQGTIMVCEIYTRGWEGRQYSSAYAHVDGWQDRLGPRLDDGSYYHGVGQNYLFCDGHVECLPIEDVLSPQGPNSCLGNRWCSVPRQ